MTTSPTCPICMLPVPELELVRHANGHFEDEEMEKDMELARQLSLASARHRHANGHYEDDQLEKDIELARQLSIAPPSPRSHSQNLEYVDLTFESPHAEISESGSASTSGVNNDCYVAKSIKEKTLYLVNVRCKASCYQVGGELIDLLKKCLELEAGNSTYMLSGYVDHFHSIPSEDEGWGCGWRNIQMASSFLLKHRPEAKQVLYGGCGFVPEIGALQRWLEMAWEKGYDFAGSSHFHGSIYGSDKWIGTTECAALFRSFGLRAKVVDFDGKDVAKNGVHVYGPMDRYISKRKRDEAGGEGCDHDSVRKIRGYQVLIDWIWRYFSDNCLENYCNGGVTVTDKMPLYFQHEGHSRTIVGIQMKRLPEGVKQYNLLILDPAHRTWDLEKALTKNSGWQRLLKRGIHTLKKPQYQLCYVDSGIATGEEMEQLKTIESTLLEF